MPYFSGQGKVYAAERNPANGNPGGFKFLGNVPELAINLGVDKVEHKDATSGQRLVDQIIHSSKSASVSFALEEFTADNLALALYGTKATQTGAAVVDESVVETGLVVGDFIKTKHPKISAVSVKDSAGTPLTLTTPAQYIVRSADHGTIELIAVPGTQPYKISYTYATYTNLTLFSQAFKERYLRFDGLNTADGNKAVVIELYRVIIDPMQDWSLLSDEFAKWNVEGTVLYDSVRASDSLLGAFGRVEMVA